MTVSARQSELFAGEVWDTLYQAFPKINFNATDPVSINLALRNYIRITYPEQFNDWIVSSEFVAIIDLLSWLAGTLAFKTDIAARENFIDTAEARESILRLARFLSYNPNRCNPATGILKITDIATNDDVFDSFGVNLANTTILWNDPNNSNWFEQFTLVLTNSFVNTNPFGVPLKAGSVSNIATQLYSINGRYSQSNAAFNANVSGTNMDFEICNSDFTDGGTLFERAPNPNNAFQIYYLNDGSGNASPRTGFFLLFKQGTTEKQIFPIGTPIENQILDISSTNVNQNDVWVQTVNDNGTVIFDWKKVPAILDSNTTFNNIPIDQRNIFSVLTRDNDEISIRFSDGRFGNAPVGNIQVIYRVSNGLQYQINPQEIQYYRQPIPYTNSSGVSKTLTLTFGLAETVANAAATETIEQIRQRAPQIYATQNRMVSGEDYNTFPLKSNKAVKIKAVNRIYAGQSRYIHDPIGTFQDLSIFADDGVFFSEVTETYFEVPLLLNKNPMQIINDYIQPSLNQYTTINLIRDVLLQNINYVVTTTSEFQWTGGTINIATLNITWRPSSVDVFHTTGQFHGSSTFFQPGCLVQFNIFGTPTWIGVIDIDSAGIVTLSQGVPNETQILAVLPAAHIALSPNVIAAMKTNIDKKLSFSLWFDVNETTGTSWITAIPVSDFGTKPAMAGTRLLIASANYINSIWCINTRGLRYVFESLSDVEWYDNGKRSLSQLTGEAFPDTISVMRVNRNLLDPRGYAQSRDYKLLIDRIWLYPNGTPEPRRTTVTSFDGDSNGIPDDPDIYYKIISPDVHNTYLFWANVTNQPHEIPIYNVIVYDNYQILGNAKPPNNTIGFQITGQTYLSDETFWIYTPVDSNPPSHEWRQAEYSKYRMERGRGPNVAASWVSDIATITPDGDQISFHWKHYASSDHRIDPATTNIHDIFVLTFAYDVMVRLWINQGADLSIMPLPPSELDLALTFADLEQSKMFSDTIVWRPVRYKFLFGNGAANELRAQFKVIRLSNIAASDGEIKSRVITAINTYFDVTRWDFGETFYFTELAAYIHQQLVGVISSVVIVPTATDTTFGDGFEVTCRADEIFISTAQVYDVVIIPSNTAINLRMR